MQHHLSPLNFERLEKALVHAYCVKTFLLRAHYYHAGYNIQDAFDNALELIENLEAVLHFYRDLQLP